MTGHFGVPDPAGQRYRPYPSQSDGTRPEDYLRHGDYEFIQVRKPGYMRTALILSFIFGACAATTVWGVFGVIIEMNGIVN